jgi:hypothetical protein
MAQAVASTTPRPRAKSRCDQRLPAEATSVPSTA